MQSTSHCKEQRNENDFAFIQCLYRQLDLGIIDKSEFLLSLEDNGLQPTLSLCQILRSGCPTLASVMKAMTFADNSVRDAHSTAQIPRQESIPHPCHSRFRQQPRSNTPSLEHLQQGPPTQLVSKEGDLGMKSTVSDAVSTLQDNRIHSTRRICHQEKSDGSLSTIGKQASPANVESSVCGSVRCTDASFDFKNWHGHKKSPTPLCALSEYKPMWNKALYNETLKEARKNNKSRAGGSRLPSKARNPLLYGPARSVDPSFDFNHWHEHRRLSTSPQTGRTECRPSSVMALIDGEEFSSAHKGKQRVNESKNLFRSCFSGSGVQFNGGPMEMQTRPHPRKKQVHEYVLQGCGTQASPTKLPFCANGGQTLHDDFTEDVDSFAQNEISESDRLSRCSRSNKKRYDYLRSNRPAALKFTCPFGSEDDVCLGSNIIGPGMDSGYRRRSVFTELFGGSTL